jgi:hypothetical protein
LQVFSGGIAECLFQLAASRALWHRRRNDIAQSRQTAQAHHYYALLVTSEILNSNPLSDTHQPAPVTPVATPCATAQADVSLETQGEAHDDCGWICLQEWGPAVYGHAAYGVADEVRFRKGRGV